MPSELKTAAISPDKTMKTITHQELLYEQWEYKSQFKVLKEMKIHVSSVENL